MASRRLFMTILLSAIASPLAAFAAGDAHHEIAALGGHTVTPESSIEQSEHIGLRAHTNFKMFVPNGDLADAQRQLFSEEASSQVGPPYAGYFFETPASLGCLYKLVPPVTGCNPNNPAIANPAGGSRAIAIVDAYHYPTAMNDLGVFSAQFGLPLPNTPNFQFQVVYANGQQPPVNADWNVEAALDIEWAHAMAPNAKIYLIEAASANFGDLLTAVRVANSLLSASGGEVSMSWGGSEFFGETRYDSYFTQYKVVYFGASGDSPGVIWPAASPNVISVGGTSISRNPSTGDFQQEVAWQSGGGGPSLYESRPSYQNGISIVQTHRGTPDVAADADPSTGVWVYASSTWYVVGGTSVAAPVWAGIVNLAGRPSDSSQSELGTLYTNQGTSDIKVGTCGPHQGYSAGPGWDFCTGLGSPLGTGGK